FYFGQIRVDPTDSAIIYVLGTSLFISRDGGHNFHTLGETKSLHPDQHALWIDSQDSDHLVIGGDGGLSLSYDRGPRWEHLANLPISQFYGVAVDNREPYRIFGGLQDNGCWYGPSATRAEEGISNRDWLRIMGSDGFRCATDDRDRNYLYAEAQYGRLERFDL